MKVHCLRMGDLSRSGRDRVLVFGYLFSMLISVLVVLTLVFYTGLRLLFFLWNASLFQSATLGEIAHAFLIGVRFDLYVVAILAAPAVLVRVVGWALGKSWSRATTVVFLVFQIPFIILNFFDVELFNFMGRRFMVSTMAIAAELQGKFFATVLSYKYILFYALVGLGLYVFESLRAARNVQSFYPPQSRSLQMGLGIILIALLGLAARGGWQRKPLNIAHSQVFTNSALSNLAMNSTFSLIKTYKKKPVNKERFMENTEMVQLMDGYVEGSCAQDLPRFQQKQNVVMIVLESFSLEHMGKPHGDRGYTPFLDELAQKGLFFPNAFANGRRSIEGIGALLGEIPSLMNEPFISSPFITNTFYGWGHELGEDYDSTFYHGGQNGTMFFDQFTQKAGIERYYGMNEHDDSEDFDGTWGIWDEPFLMSAVKDMSVQKQPFSSTIFTLTSHNPYVVPKEYRGQFPKGTSRIHEVIGYTDAVLRKFFKEAEKQPWYKNTLFIISADHTDSSGTVRDRYKNDLGAYRIPLVFFHPQISKWPNMDLQEPVQQVDVLPSVLDFLGQTPSHKNLMGRSVFCKGPRYVVIHQDGSYWLVNRTHVLHQTPTGKNNLASLEDPFVPAGRPPRWISPVLSKAELEAMQNRMIRQLQATRQYFSQGLWDNALYVKDNKR